MPRGRPRKYTQLELEGMPEIQNLEQDEVMNTMKDIKHLVFGLSTRGEVEGGPRTNEEIREFIKKNYFDLNEGWELFSVIFLGEIPGELYQLLYTLVKR